MKEATRCLGMNAGGDSRQHRCLGKIERLERVDAAESSD